MIDRGVVYCQGTSWPGNYLPAAGNQWDFGPVSTSYGLAGKAPTKVAAGKQHGCIVANGQLFCWGNGAKGVRANGDSSASASNSSIVPKLTGIAGPPETDIGTTEGTHAATGPIDTGDKHGCAAVNGHIYCWGNNDYGQLGTGNRMSSTRPTSVNFPKSYNSVTKISVGKDHSCAIVEGNLYCWGNNEDGKLGTGTGPSSPSYTASPVKIDIASNARVTDVSAGTSGTCAVAEGRAYCWGKNDKAQLGTGDKDSKDTPTLVSAASPNPTIETNSLADKAVTSISLGQEHACAVANGDLYCWGNNSNGRNGLGSSNATGESLPTLLTLGTAGRPKGPNNMTPLVTSVSAGKDFTCAIINAKVSCWGDNTGGKTGRDTETSNIYEPTALTGAAASYYATTISAGDSHACALLHGDNSQTNGNIFCWGDNTNGQLGRGYSGNTPPDHMVAMRVSSAAGSDMRDSSIGGEVRSAINISVGSQSSCTIANAVILCWGDNTYGQLGTGDTAPSVTPIKTTKYQIPSSAYALGPIF